MARYIKANPKVAQYLNLENDRNTVADGNYLLWQADMLEFGPLTELNNTLAMIGGLALMPHEAREEQDGTVIRPLPEPTDERFRYQPVPPVEEPGEEVEEQPEGNGESETPTDQPEAETPTEGNGESQEPEAETPVEGNGESQEPEAETPVEGNGNGESQEPEAETPVEGNGESQEPEAETPVEGNGESQEPEAEAPTEGNGESQEITAGDVGSVEDLINFAPAEETE